MQKDDGSTIERQLGPVKPVLTTPEEGERCILVALCQETGQLAEDRCWRSLDELAELAKTSGATIVATVMQKKQKPDPATLIGSGKLQEIKELAVREEADTLIFDDALSGSQFRNIAEQTRLNVLDRPLVIMDIFARRAQSSEGKLQVELAQYEYRMTRLSLINEELSRLGGGIGTRGPGETQLETDRRHVQQRITHLKRELASVATRRKRVREKRSENGLMIAAVVGYTNAGKSTLINKLSNSDLFTMDQVFATLDPAYRRLDMASGNRLLLVDTVGFIRNLPPQLVDAFHSTLEEVQEADLILQVTDVSDPDHEEQVMVVERQLRELEVMDRPRIHILNKIDRLDDEAREHLIPEPLSEQVRTRREEDNGVRTRGDAYYKVIAFSSLTGQGQAELEASIAEVMRLNQRAYDLRLPYSETTLAAYIRDNGAELEEAYSDEGIQFKFLIDRQFSGPVERWLADQDRQGK